MTSLALGLSPFVACGWKLDRGECVCLGYVIGSAIASTLTLAIAWLSHGHQRGRILLA